MKARCRLLLVLLAVALARTSVSLTKADSHFSVSVWEEPLVIPTYRVGEPERNPIFYLGRAYQGVKGSVYPYPMLDKLTDAREDRTYRALYLENRYLKVCVLPEIGGRILAAQDKTNGYDFVYRQHVIKPALIGMLGAWISGGVEWNVLHHHRASTFMPVDYTLTENPDGSKTIWVGEIELRHRMKWLIGLTLYPDKSYLEATVRIFNRTACAHSVLYFANAAVHANSDYQVIFPPGTEYATYHGKNEFLPWPISDRDFGGLEFGRQVDVSWWKNHPAPTSWFCWNYEEDFFGGYDHGRRAGIVHVADHHVVPGKKFFAWGTGDDGKMWDKILTDNDGPYLELMAGAYSDNQPDYSWMQPYEVRTFRQYWYPIRELGGVKNANLEAAVNLEVNLGGRTKIAFNTTSEYTDAKAVLKAGDGVVFEQPLDIAPDRPFAKELSLPSVIMGNDLMAALYASDGRELVSYRPVRPKNLPVPQPLKPPPAPKHIKTVEELFLTGLRLEQFHSPAAEPYPYYEEALKRDPGNYRVNTQLGVLYYKRGLLSEAQKRLRAAVERATKDYTSPKDGEALYYLGVVLEAQGRRREARDAYYKAAWTAAWQAAAYYALGRLSCFDGAFAAGLEFLDRSLVVNSVNTSALNLKAAILRRTGRLEEAAQVAQSALAIDPLDFWAGNEAYLALRATGRSADAKRTLDSLLLKMRGENHSYLELAVDYANAGMWDEAIDVLSRLEKVRQAGGCVNPLVYYSLAFFLEQIGRTEEASKYYQLGSEASPDYCFPFQQESAAVLQRAKQHNPNDARAPYYLGNLLFDWQPDAALDEWQLSRRLNPAFAAVHRNLGVAYAQVEKNLPKAIASLEKAIECDPSDARLYFELDQLSERAGVAPQTRLARLEANRELLLKRDDSAQQLASLYVILGHYDKALELLQRRHFHVWEGGGDIHDLHVSTHVLRGHEHFRRHRYGEALRDYEAALEYPENLEVGRPTIAPRDAEIYYFIGEAREALGNVAGAMEAWQKAVAVELTSASEFRYFQGLAWQRLGQATQAARAFRVLLTEGRRELSDTSDMDYFAKFGERRSEAARKAHGYYLMALGHLGQGKYTQAKAALRQVLDYDMNHLGAQARLAALP